VSETEIYIFIASLVITLLLNLITVAAQTALLQTNLPRLLHQSEQDGIGAERAITLLQSSLKVQASLNLARLFWRFILAGLVLYAYFQIFEFNAMLPGIGLLLLAAVVLYIIEAVTQTIIMGNPTGWTIRLAWYARGVMILFSPIVELARLISGSEKSVAEVSGVIEVSEDDLRTLVDAPQQEGTLDQGERKMIHSIFELGNTLAREIMVPRIDMLALDVLTPLPDAVDAFLKSGHSRVPVYEDTVDNILGLLYAKDLLRVWREGDQLGSLRSLLRRAYFVPEAKKVDELLAEMQRWRVHIAVVVDEYGGVAGLVTLEDIVEEILGEIQDEYDQAEELPYEALADGEYIFQGRIDLDDFNEVFDSGLPKEEADTLAGFIYSRLGRVPATGESLQVDNLLLTVELVSGRRIQKVRVRNVLTSPSKDEKVNDVSE
jgi:CBS domain containing-hemolysin-like protein